MNNRILRKIWICSDVLMDIFPFFGHAQLGLKLALISPRFDALVDKQFSGKRELPILRTIAIDKDVGLKPKLFVILDSKSVQFPLPDRPLPNKIRFNCLRIRYIDHSVITFLRSNQHIWGRGMSMSLRFHMLTANEKPNWEVFAREIWPIFAPYIRHLFFRNADQLDNLRRLISPTILTDCNQLNSIEAYGMFPDVLNNFDGPNATSAGQILSKWLHIPSKDGQPKRLLCFYDHNGSRTKAWVNNFKEAFLNATTNSPVNYCIRFETQNPLPIVPFELLNERTNEKLTFEKERGNEFANEWVFKRCPIFEGTAAAVQWEDENLYALVNILLRNNNHHRIGPLSPPTSQQMSNSQSAEVINYL